MGTGFFNYIAQACQQLAATAAPSITAMGIHIVIALATIMLVWFGVQEALASAQGGPGFSMAKFLNLFMLMTFAYAMVNYYDSSIPGLGFSIKSFIDGGTNNLVALIGADGSTTMLNEIHVASSKTGPSMLTSMMSPYAEEELLNSTVKQYEQALELNESRFQGGIASEVEVEQAKTQLQTTRAAAIDVGVLRAQYEHAVAILIGKAPAEFSLPPMPLTTPPPHVPISVSSELLERRPDIAAAERRVASANAQIGVAKSAYYPLISLGASGGFESSAITTLINGPSGLWSIGLSAVGTVFDVGRRRALNDEARAAYDYQVAAYRENVLTGFQQVEDNLAAVRILKNEAKVQDEAVVAAQRSLDLSVTRYKGGVTSYLEVITAQSAALSDEVTAVNILGRRMANTVLLIQALGGGWDRSSLPDRPECCGKLASSNARP
jgi:Outer membrane efflux protein